MSHSPALERRYRRLLAWYPAAHRRIYAEEMIGVLLASASNGRRRPDLADTVDLIAGAMRVRGRALLTGKPDPGWRDALALSSLLAPFLLGVLLIGQNLGWMAALLWHSWNGTTGLLVPIWPALVLLAPMAIALARLRWAAVAAAAALLAWVTVQGTLGQRVEDPRFAAYLLLLGVQVVALAGSDGPRRGLRLLSGRAVLMAAPCLVTVAYAAGVIPTHYPIPVVVAEVVIVVVAIAGLPALASAGGRRVLVLLVGIPGSAFVVSLMTFASVDFYSMSFTAAQFAMYLPPVLLACLTALAISRAGRQSPPACGRTDPS